jgi:hypothetical protein
MQERGKVFALKVCVSFSALVIIMVVNSGFEELLQFPSQIDNTVRNFIPSNALVTAWALEQRRQGKSNFLAG